MAAKLAPVCLRCRKEMRCKRNGVSLQFIGGTVFRGDAFECDCGTQIVTGFGQPMELDDGQLAQMRAVEGEDKWVEMPV